MDELITVFFFEDKKTPILAEPLTEMVTGGLVVILGIILVLLPVLILPHLKKESFGCLFYAIPGALFGVFMIWWGAGLFSMHNSFYSLKFQEYQKLSQTYNSQQYEIVEGTVDLLHTQPAWCHDTGDIVRIGNSELEIDYCFLTLGYNKTVAHGGVLTQGVYARVYHKDGIILRIDLKRPNIEQASSGLNLVDKHSIYLPLVMRDSR